MTDKLIGVGVGILWGLGMVTMAGICFAGFQGGCWWLVFPVGLIATLWTAFMFLTLRS